MHLGNGLIMAWQWLKSKQLLPRLTFVLVSGFLAITALNYWISGQLIQNTLSQHILPLINSNIYLEVSQSILRPIDVSSKMAHNTFVSQWVLDGEKNPQEIKSYLEQIQSKNHAVTAFLVSEKTRNYYHPTDTIKKISTKQENDQWYFNSKKSPNEYEVNIEFDSRTGVDTVFINYHIKGENGDLLGITGVGITLDGVRKIIDYNQKEFDSRIYFIDRLGNIKLSGSGPKKMPSNIRERKGISEISDQILSSTKKSHTFVYRLDGVTHLVNARYIPELNWFLLVKHNQHNSIKPLNQLLVLNFIIGGLVTALVLAFTIPTLKRHQLRLEKAAQTDTLTKLDNRHAFDEKFERYMEHALENETPLALILIDIDHFKKVNDDFGHLTGDVVLKKVAKILKDAVRSGDVVARWGGEEFIILLKECPLESARDIAIKMCQEVAEHSFGLDERQITISCGVAVLKKDENADQFLHRTDTALYKAKEDGRNQVYTET